jgi:glycosyltransferase 2 family protein
VTKRRAILLALVFLVLAALVYVQFRTWKTFDWSLFLARTREADPKRLAAAVALIYSVYYLRALRWKIFLKPVCRATAARLTPPQFIGFAGLALLGRPGEFIRPYLIARRENLTFPSQIAVWMVERIFDTGSVTLLLAVTLFSGAFSSIPFFQSSPHMLARVRQGGYILIAGVVVVALAAFVIRRNGDALAAWLEARLRGRLPHLSHRIAQKVRSFGQGLNTIHGPVAFVQLAALSFGIWTIIGLAYVEVVKAYPDPKLHGILLPHVVLLMVSSMAGSVLQLPGIGGGSQLATIAVLAGVFGVPQELAASCGVMLWLITFMAVVPAGLFLAQREHISLRKLEAEAHVED